MKQLLLFAIFLFITFNSYSQNQLVINGKVDGKTKGIVYLLTWNGEKPVKIDSAKIRGGEFNFYKSVSLPAVYLMSLAEVKSRLPIFLFPDETPMKVNLKVDPVDGKLSDFSLTGGKVQTAYNVHYKVYKSHLDDYLKLNEVYKKAKLENNVSVMQEQKGKMAIKGKIMSDLESKMIDNNSDNILSLFFICNKYQKTDQGTAKTKLAKVSSRLQSSELYKHLSK